MISHQAIGIDVGGTGIKGALVDTAAGSLLSQRYRLKTPPGGKPDAVLDIVKAVIASIPDVQPHTPIGITLPSVVQHGATLSAANIDDAWIGLKANEFFSDGLDTDAYLVNDADAAGLAEIRYGAGKDIPGTVLMTTLGTGIGSALFVDGMLVPNTELGHMDVGNVENYETYASTIAKEREDLSFKRWAKRLQKYYAKLEQLFWPDLFIVGGGVSKSHEKFLPLLELRTPIVPAQLRNNAGIIGAAVLAASSERRAR